MIQEEPIMKRTVITKQSKPKLNTNQISALSSKNVNEYQFLTGGDILLEKDLLGKAATIKRFEHSPLGSVLKKQAKIAKQHYQKLDKRSL